MQPQRFDFILLQLESKILGKSFSITQELLVQTLGYNTIYLSQVGIQHYLLASNQEYAAIDIADAGYIAHATIYESELKTLHVGRRRNAYRRLTAKARNNLGLGIFHLPP